MYLRDHLGKLRYFYEIARLGSMKKASESIYITQPSLTKSIKILEEAVGNPLFNRLPRGVSLTIEGKLLYNFCHNLFASITDIEQRLTHPQEPLAGSLRVGTYDSIGIYFWPRFLESFLPQYPKLDFEMSFGRSLEMHDKLEANELDLILVVEPQSTAQTTIEILKKDTFKFYESTKVKKVYKSYEKAPLIIMPTALTGSQCLKNVVESYKITSGKFYTSSSLESVKELALYGIGVALLPQMVAKDAVRKRKLVEVQFDNIPVEGIGEHSIGIAYQNSRKESPLIKILIEELKRYEW